MNSTIITNPTNVTASENDADPSLLIITLFGIYYVSALLIGILGNILIIASVCTYKHMRTVVNGFLLNVAISDLLFAIFSTFDAIKDVYEEWQIGDISCRIQGLLIEVSYTVSVLTLVAVALERYISICYPYRRKRTFNQSLYMSTIIWVVGLSFCFVLGYGYTAKNDENGEFKCQNNNWSNKSRRTFYIIHSILIYLIHLSLMCLSHYKITKTLIHQQKYRSTTIRNNTAQVNISTPNIKENANTKVTVKTTSTDEVSAKNNKPLQAAFRRVKIIKLLIVVTSILFYPLDSIYFGSLIVIF